MGSGGVVLALDTPENREVGGDAVGYFHLRPSSLSGILCEWLADAGLRESMRERARRRAGTEYGWESVTERYQQLFVKFV
jgi:glycosyltransferase involved in cell wall biosynthesis